MAASLEHMRVQCPYCWEVIDVLIDDCGEAQEYIEDCQVCCRPVNFRVDVDDTGQLNVSVFTEDE